MNGSRIGLIALVAVGCGASPTVDNHASVAPSAITVRDGGIHIPPGVFADPVRYTGFMITDGQLGAWSFHNARVYLRFDSDASNAVYTKVVPDPNFPNDTVDTYINSTGVASIRIVTAAQDVTAKFAPNQIFVSADVGDTVNVPHYGARGIGFGSFSKTAAGGIEPTYPMGIEDGSLDWGDVVGHGSASPALSSLSFDLGTSVAVSGRAWSCIGFPDATCPKPTAPLATDQGNLYLFQPYQIQTDGQGDDPMNAGFFVVERGVSAGDTDGDDGAEGNAFVAAPAKAPEGIVPPGIRRYAPISYHAYVIADVTLGKRQFINAQVYLSFDSNGANVVPFNQGGFSGFMNSVGNAHAKIVSGGHTYTADFAPEQIFVFYDLAHSYLGFGSTAGGFGYPLSLTSGINDPDGLTNQSLMQAVTDIAEGTIPSGEVYPPETSTLGTNLLAPTALSGPASSCVALNPATNACTNLTPVALQTNQGDFYLYESYTVSDNDTDGGVQPPHTINWGVFWTDGMKPLVVHLP